MENEYILLFYLKKKKEELNVVFNSLPFWVFSGCVLFFLFFCFAVGVSGDLFLLFLDCLKPTPQ